MVERSGGRETIGLCLNSKVDIKCHRRTITLLFLFLKRNSGNSSVIKLIGHDNYIKDKEIFYKIGEMLITDIERKMTYNTINSYRSLKFYANKFKVSKSFLNWYLFYKDDNERWQKIKEEFPSEAYEIKKKRDNNGGGTPAKVIKHFLRDKTRSSVNQKELPFLIFSHKSTKDAKIYFNKYEI